MKPEAVEEKRKDKIPYEYYSGELKNFTPMLISENTGVIFEEEKSRFKINLIQETYYVSYPDGAVYGEDENIKYALKTLLLRYLINAKGVKPKGEMIHYRDVPDGNIYYSNFYGRCLMRLSKTFKDKYDLFIKASEALAGEKIEQGDMGYKFRFLNDIFVYVILWKGDEEFPPSAQILFSDNVQYYFSAEDLAFVGDIINDKLAKAAFSR